MKTCKSLARAMEWVDDVSFLIYTVLPCQYSPKTWVSRLGLAGRLERPN